MPAATNLFSRLARRLRFDWYEGQNLRRLEKLTYQVAKRAPQPGAEQKPVVFFNASTRLNHVSLNAAFSLLTAWSLRLKGVPVRHFVCNAGMSHCVLGSDPDNPRKPPPCDNCIAQSQALYRHAQVEWFNIREYTGIDNLLMAMELEDLTKFIYRGIPLGNLVLPSFRWRMRVHHLTDNEAVRYLYRQFILSAYNIHRQFIEYLDRVDPAAIVVFNGMMYPEAVVRQIAEQRSIPVISHEVSFQPFSAFFTTGQATAYPINIPDDFELNEAQNARLDRYLQQRFQGNFTMAGIQFWPEMRGLDPPLLDKIAQFKQVVPIFTNVIFDTSQPHANTVFRNMFTWLDNFIPVIKDHPDTLFVVRAHPDELRPGTRKQSRQSVRMWVEEKKIKDLPNVVFIDSQDYVSSYELIQRAKFVCVYNSSIALEAALIGAVVLAGGSSRFTPYRTMYFPHTFKHYRSKLLEFLAAEQLENPPEFQRNARRFYYFQNYRTPIPFGEYLDAQVTKGYVRFKNFKPDQLLPENSTAMQVLHDGILRKKDFFMPEPEDQ